MRFTLFLLLSLTLPIHPMIKILSENSEPSGFFYKLGTILVARAKAILHLTASPEERIRLLSQRQAQDQDIQSLKDVALAQLVENLTTNPTTLDMILKRIPADLQEPLMNIFKQRHAVQLMKTFPLRLRKELLGTKAEAYHICPNRRYMIMCDNNVYYAYRISKNTREPLGMLQGPIWSFSYDSKYACVLTDNQAHIVSLPDLQILTSQDITREELKHTKYLLFDAASRTSFLSMKNCSIDSSGCRARYQFDAEESQTYLPDMYIFSSSLNTAYQWEHYLMSMNDQYKQLACLPAYKRLWPDIIEGYWNTTFYKYLQAHGIKEATYSGSITTNGRYAVRQHSGTQFVLIDLHNLDSFDAEKNLFTLKDKNAIHRIDCIQTMTVNPTGKLVLIEFSTRAEQGQVANLSPHIVCLYDLTIKDWHLLLIWDRIEMQRNGRWQRSEWLSDFWFNNDGSSFEIYSNRSHYTGHFEDLAPDSTLQDVASLVTCN